MMTAFLILSSKLQTPRWTSAIQRSLGRVFKMGVQPWCFLSAECTCTTTPCTWKQSAHTLMIITKTYWADWHFATYSYPGNAHLFTEISIWFKTSSRSLTKSRISIFRNAWNSSYLRIDTWHETTNNWKVFFLVDNCFRPNTLVEFTIQLKVISKEIYSWSRFASYELINEPTSISTQQNVSLCILTSSRRLVVP